MSRATDPLATIRRRVMQPLPVGRTPAIPPIAVLADRIDRALAARRG